MVAQENGDCAAIPLMTVQRQERRTPQDGARAVSRRSAFVYSRRPWNESAEPLARPHVSIVSRRRQGIRGVETSRAPAPITAWCGTWIEAFHEAKTDVEHSRKTRAGFDLNCVRQ